MTQGPSLRPHPRPGKRRQPQGGRGLQYEMRSQPAARGPEAARSAGATAVALPPGGPGSREGAPRVPRPRGDPWLQDQGQHQTQLMSAKETGREESDPADVLSPAVGQVRSRGPEGGPGPARSEALEKMAEPRARALRPAVVEAACTWASPRPSGHRGPGVSAAPGTGRPK